MYVVVLNPCPDPTAYTVEARWGRDGTDRPPTPVPRQETSKPEEERSRKGEGGVCDSEGHCSLAGGGSDSGVWEESRLRKRFARQAMEGSFTPAAGRPHGLSAMDQPLPWYIQVRPTRLCSPTTTNLNFQSTDWPQLSPASQRFTCIYARSNTTALWPFELRLLFPTLYLFFRQHLLFPPRTLTAIRSDSWQSLRVLPARICTSRKCVSFL
jgi:hypothetical protein